MKRFSLLIIASVLFFLFLITPDTVQKAAYESVLFCSAVVIPSLFPGFVLSNLILSLSTEGSISRRKGFLSRIFQPPAGVRCWLIGLLAGFPAAADCTCRMYASGILTKDEGERLLAFTNNPGIVFVICAVGSSLFGSVRIGLFLWGILTVSALYVGILFSRKKLAHRHKTNPSPPKSKTASLFPDAVTKAVSAVLNVCGFILFFRVLIAALTATVPLNSFRIFLSGLLEITCGISALTDFTQASASIASFILSWSGFSIHFQILNLTARSGLSLRYYFPGKIIQALISSILTWGLYPIFFSQPKERDLIHLTVTILLIAGIPFFFRLGKELLHGKRNLQTRKTAS